MNERSKVLPFRSSVARDVYLALRREVGVLGGEKEALRRIISEPRTRRTVAQALLRAHQQKKLEALKIVMDTNFSTDRRITNAEFIEHGGYQVNSTVRDLEGEDHFQRVSFLVIYFGCEMKLDEVEATFQSHCLHGPRLSHLLHFVDQCGDDEEITYPLVSVGRDVIATIKQRGHRKYLRIRRNYSSRTRFTPDCLFLAIA